MLNFHNDLNLRHRPLHTEYKNMSKLFKCDQINKSCLSVSDEGMC